MGSRFTFRFRRKEGGVIIQLKGDLDGSTAHVLADALRRNCSDGQSITVDTTGLRSVHPFGKEVFSTILPHLGEGTIRFMGPHSKDLSGFHSV